MVYNVVLVLLKLSVKSCNNNVDPAGPFNSNIAGLVSASERYMKEFKSVFLVYKQKINSQKFGKNYIDLIVFQVFWTYTNLHIKLNKFQIKTKCT